MSTARQDSSWNGETGATLVELIIYLALAATILVTVNNGVQLFQRNASQSVSAAQRSAGLDLAFAKVSDIVASIARVPVQQGKSAVFAFDGTPTRISFLADDETGLAAMQLIVVQKKSGSVLLLAAENSQPRILLEGAYTIRFSYRGERGRDTGWRARWPQQNRMPDLIRMNLHDARSGEALSLPLVAALMRDAETACNDPKAPDCTISSSGELTWAPG